MNKTNSYSTWILTTSLHVEIYIKEALPKGWNFKNGYKKDIKRGNYYCK